MTFQDGGINIAGCVGVALVSGSATCTTAALAAGIHTIAGNYSGNAGNAASSGSVTQTVNAVVLPSQPVRNVPALALPALALAIVGTMSAIPVFWQLPNLFLSGAAAACGIALINSIANLAGFGAPWFLGVVKTRTGNFTGGLYTVAIIEAVALLLIVVFIPRKKLA